MAYANVVNVVEVNASFTPECMVKALASHYFLDPLMFRLCPVRDEFGELPNCPITLAPIVRNAAMIHDGSVYQQGPIKQWLSEHGTSPLTNLPLPHRQILRLTSLKDVLHVYLDSCRELRTERWKHQISAANQKDGRSYDQLQEELQELESYIREATVEICKWREHISNLQRLADNLRRDMIRCSRAQARASARQFLNDVFVRQAKIAGTSSCKKPNLLCHTSIFCAAALA